MHFAVPHKTTQSQAVQKVKLALEHGKPQLKEYATIDAEKWDGNTLTFAATVQGKEITGKLEVSDTDYIIDATLPLLWRMFESRIEKMITDGVQSLG